MIHHQHQFSPDDSAASCVQEPDIMAPQTPFAVLADRCGLSQREASEYLKVRIDTVKSWCAGRNVAKPAVLAELRALYSGIEAAGVALAEQVMPLLDRQREKGFPQRAIVFGLAETDDVCRAYGFPSAGPYAAALGIAMSRLPDDVDIVMEPQSYPGMGGGGGAPTFPGTKLTWPPKR